jgi:hypothetical protein
MFCIFSGLSGIPSASPATSNSISACFFSGTGTNTYTGTNAGSSSCTDSYAGTIG